jgi:hypothetical protein
MTCPVTLLGIWRAKSDTHPRRARQESLRHSERGRVVGDRGQRLAMLCSRPETGERCRAGHPSLLTWFETMSRRPTMRKLATMLDPPYETYGSVIPVSGIRPVTPAVMMKA